MNTLVQLKLRKPVLKRRSRLGMIAPPAPSRAMAIQTRMFESPGSVLDCWEAGREAVWATLGLPPDLGVLAVGLPPGDAIAATGLGAGMRDFRSSSLIRYALSTHLDTLYPFLNYFVTIADMSSCGLVCRRGSVPPTSAECQPAARGASRRLSIKPTVDTPKTTHPPRIAARTRPVKSR